MNLVGDDGSFISHGIAGKLLPVFCIDWQPSEAPSNLPVDLKELCEIISSVEICAGQLLREFVWSKISRHALASGSQNRGLAPGG